MATKARYTIQKNTHSTLKVNTLAEVCCLKNRICNPVGMLCPDRCVFVLIMKVTNFQGDLTGICYNKNPAVQATNCPAGSVTKCTGATSISACVACRVGTHAVDGTCEPCPPGTWGRIMTGRGAVCTPCPPGTASAVLASVDAADCEACTTGTYSDKPGAMFCKECSVGSYCETEGLSIPLPCPKGSVALCAGARSAAACSSCGESEVGVLDTCRPCRPGTYLDESPLSGRDSECLYCPAGTFSLSPGATSQASCSPCPAGSYSSAGSTACTRCPPGYYSSARASTCTACMENTYSSVAGGSSYYVCKPCPTGTHSSAGSYVCEWND